MEKIGSLIGIYLCVCMGSVWSQATVTVNEDMLMKPGESVALNCIGDNGDISFYIRNRVNWELKFPNGTVRKLTDGFYTHRDSKSLFEGTNAIYRFSYGKGDNGQHFNITIKDLQFSDDGEYTCTLYDEGNNIISQKTTRLTVVSPVRKLVLELHKPDGMKITRESFVEGDTAHKLSPGTYMASCMARGSNPQPVIRMSYDGTMLDGTQSDELVVISSAPTYTSKKEVATLNLKSMESEQILLCEANTADESYLKKRAGIKMLINIEKPLFKCSNLSTAPEERYRKLECVLMAKPGASLPLCENVFWKFGEEGNMHKVGHNEKYSDQKQKLFGTVQSACKEIENGLDVTLTIFIMKADHLKTTFYIGYGVGNDAEQTPIVIDLKDITTTTQITSTLTVVTTTTEIVTTLADDETSGASVLTPLSLLISLLAAIFSRHVARSL